MKQSNSLLKQLILASFISLTGYSLAAPDQSPISTKETSMPTITLNNGVNMPQLGFGVWGLNKAETVRAVKIALAQGYRHIDTAQYYQNEAETYQAIKESGIDRKEVFITTKVYPPHKHNANMVRESLDESLKLLGGDYIDLVLIHWPADDQYNKEMWQIFEEYVAQGKIKSIGVSNFSPSQLESLIKTANIKPVLNQIEIHPYRAQRRNTELNEKMGVAVETYSPLGAGGSVLRDTTLIGLANKYNKSVPQVILRWNIQRGLITIPRSKNKAHIAENSDIFNFELTAEDMATINSLSRD